MTYIAVEVEKLEDWLHNIGCQKGVCPNDYVCIWNPPGNLPPFSAPNPNKYQFIPMREMARLADIIREIMKKGGLGVP